MADRRTKRRLLSRGTSRRQVVQAIPTATAGRAATALTAKTALAEEPAPVSTAHKEPPEREEIARTLPKPSFDDEEVESTAWEIYQCKSGLERFSGRGSCLR